ncbi:MAG: hypothetical protein ACO2O6_05390 [Candidatus Hydrothermia bacterium]|jgi:hypothetical protein
MRWIKFYLRFKSFYNTSIKHIPQYFNIKFYPEIVPYSKEEIISLNGIAKRNLRGIRWIIEGEITQLSTSENMLPYMIFNEKIYLDLFAIKKLFVEEMERIIIIPIFINLPCILEVDYERKSKIDLHNIKFKAKSDLFKLDKNNKNHIYYNQFWFRILKVEYSNFLSRLIFVSILPNEIVVNNVIGHIIQFESPLPSLFRIYNKNYPSLYIELTLNECRNLAYPVEALVLNENNTNVKEFYFEQIDLRRIEI